MKKKIIIKTNLILEGIFSEIFQNKKYKVYFVNNFLQKFKKKKLSKDHVNVAFRFDVDDRIEDVKNIIKINNQYNFPISFFFLTDQKHYADDNILKKIKFTNSEIGLHSNHYFLANKNLKIMKRNIIKSKKKLFFLTKKKISGILAHGNNSKNFYKKTIWEGLKLEDKWIKKNFSYYDKDFNNLFKSEKVKIIQDFARSKNVWAYNLNFLVYFLKKLKKGESVVFCFHPENYKEKKIFYFDLNFLSNFFL